VVVVVIAVDGAWQTLSSEYVEIVEGWSIVCVLSLLESGVPLYPTF